MLKLNWQNHELYGIHAQTPFGIVSVTWKSGYSERTFKNPTATKIAESYYTVHYPGGAAGKKRYPTLPEAQRGAELTLAAWCKTLLDQLTAPEAT